MEIGSIDTLHSNKTYTIKSKQYFQSPDAKSSAKRCFEFTWKGGIGHHLVGFWCGEGHFKVITYYHQVGRPLFFEEWNAHTSPTYPIQEGEAGMVCIDTEKSIFSLIKGSQTQNFSYIMKDLKNWRACVTGGSSKGSDNITINLGQTPFSNTIPKGYLPWFFGANDLIYSRRKIIRKQKKSLSLFTLNLVIIWC